MRSGHPGPATRAIAIAGIVPAVLFVPGHALATGGLPGLAGGVLVGALAGVPAARAEWRSGPLPPGVSARLVEVTGGLVVGATLGPLATTPGKLLAVVAALGAVGAAVSRWGVSAQRALLALAAGGLALALGSSAAPVGPWTLLEPRWEAARQGAGIGLVLGALLAAVGFGAWCGTPWIPGVAGRRPFAAVGIAALAGLVALVEVAWRAEAAAEAPVAPSSAGALAATLLALSAGGAIAGRAGGWSRRVLGMAIATAWFAGPARGIGPWFWCVLLPVAIASPLAMRPGPGRWLAGATGLGIALCWPGIPATPGDAAIAALTGVAGFWVVATGQLLDRRVA